MPDPIANFLAHPMDVLRALPRQQMLVMLLIGGAVVTSLVLVVRWAAQPAYVTAYSELSASETSKMAQALDAAKIAYKVSADGSALMVPEIDVEKARATLVKGGLPASGRPGFEIFDKPAWGMTDFTQKVNYQRALESEIERNLKNLRAVKDARVMLTLPEKTPFKQDERPAEASVTLSIRPGAELNRETIRGITYLVASAVERLAPEQVTVMDDEGTVLSAPDDGSVASLAGRQLETQNAVEQQLARKVSDLVTSVVGPGNVRVQVSARLNFDQVRKETQSFDPDKQVVVSEQKQEDPITGAATPSGDIEASASTTNYDNTRSVESVENQVGNITRLSVAVMVNDHVIPKGDSATYKPLTADELARIEDLVKTAVGFDPERGDKVTVHNTRFQKQPLSEPYKTPLWQTLLRFTRPALYLLALIMGLLFVRRLLRALKEMPRAPQFRRAGEGGEIDFAIPLDTEPEVPSLVEETRRRASTRPEAANRLIKNWMHNG